MSSTFGNSSFNKSFSKNAYYSSGEKINFSSGDFNLTQAMVYNQRKGYNQFSHEKRKHRIELLVPVNSFNYSNHKSEKIQRRLTQMKILDKKGIQTTGFRNRPILNLNRNEFNFTPKNLIFPSATHRVLVSAPNKTRSNFSFGGINVKNRNKLRLNNYEENSQVHDYFKKALNTKFINF